MLDCHLVSRESGGRTCHHAGGVLIRPEEHYVAPGSALRFHALEHRLSVVQDLRAGVQLEGPVGLKLPGPALLGREGCPVHGLHGTGITQDHVADKLHIAIRLVFR